MTGGLMQLVAYGAQDIYLTGNPTITYFKSVYRRHTNFAMESIQQTLSGNIGFGNKVSSIISRNGDLISGCYIEITLPFITQNGGAARWTDCVGHYLLDTIDIEIGGQLIDRHYSDWLEIWAQLSIPSSKSSYYFEMIGLDGDMGLQTATTGEAGDNDKYVGVGANVNKDGNRVLYVPLQFWFCRNVGLALPLIALQYHEVKINITLGSFDNLTINASLPSGQSLGIALWADYIYLDTDERRRFAQVSHEYLIDQLQVNDAYNTGATATVDLILNHPVKELIWVYRKDAHEASKQWINFTNTEAANNEYFGRPKTLETSTIVATTEGINEYRRKVSSNMIQTARLQLNGHDRTDVHSGTYLNRYVPYHYHTSVPASPGINVYSFALKPEDHQPSGTCNFSRIDNAKLVLTINTNGGNAVGAEQSIVGKIKIYAVNYNVLRIMSGMGGVAYSN